jgi:hypothetical protein
MPDMNDNLKWRTVAELRLTDPIVPNPNSTSELLNRLNHVRVAVDNGLLHIDPRPVNQPLAGGADTEYNVTVVPTSAVEYISYRVAPAEPNFVSWADL